MDQKKKKIPMRQCVGCGEHFPKGELIRVVRSPEGEISLDVTGRKNGRGVYICPRSTCLVKAKKSGRLAQHLDCEIPDGIYGELEHRLEELK